MLPRRRAQATLPVAARLGGHGRHTVDWRMVTDAQMPHLPGGIRGSVDGVGTFVHPGGVFSLGTLVSERGRADVPANEVDGQDDGRTKRILKKVRGHGWDVTQQGSTFRRMGPQIRDWLRVLEVPVPVLWYK